jgi:hypothetical protein
MRDLVVVADETLAVVERGSHGAPSGQSSTASGIDRRQRQSISSRGEMGAGSVALRGPTKE